MTYKNPRLKLNQGQAPVSLLQLILVAAFERKCKAKGINRSCYRLDSLIPSLLSLILL